MCRRLSSLVARMGRIVGQQPEARWECTFWWVPFWGGGGEAPRERTRAVVEICGLAGRKAAALRRVLAWERLSSAGLPLPGQRRSLRKFKIKLIEGASANVTAHAASARTKYKFLRTEG